MNIFYSEEGCCSKFVIITVIENLLFEAAAALSDLVKNGPAPQHCTLYNMYDTVNISDPDSNWVRIHIIKKGLTD